MLALYAKFVALLTIVLSGLDNKNQGLHSHPAKVLAAIPKKPVCPQRILQKSRLGNHRRRLEIRK